MAQGKAAARRIPSSDDQAVEPLWCRGCRLLRPLRRRHWSIAHAFRQVPPSLLACGGLPMLKLTTLSLTLLTAATPAFAQSDDMIVVTASGIEQSRDEVGQAITIIDADTIATRQSVDIVDLLATTPGVRFSRTGSMGSAAGISLRGAETTQTLVLIDGVKVNDPSGIGDGYDFGHLLTGNINRIEVLRGSNSVVHGSQAIGGGGRHRKGRLQEFRGQRAAESRVQRRDKPRPARLLYQRRPGL